MILVEGQDLPSNHFDIKTSFITRIITESSSSVSTKQGKVTIPIEIPPKPEIQMPDSDSFLFTKRVKVKAHTKAKKQRKENKGIIVTIDNFLTPKVSSLKTVTYIQALPFDKLPPEYLTSDLPKVWQDGDKLLSGNNYVLLKKGATYSRDRLTRTLLYIELAGEHLARVKEDKDKRWFNSDTATFKDGKLKSCTPRK